MATAKSTKKSMANEPANILMVHPTNPTNKVPTTRRAFEILWEGKGWKILENSGIKPQDDKPSEKDVDSETKPK